MNYLDFVEEYNEKKEVNLFQKVLVTAKRAKDIFEDRSISAYKEQTPVIASLCEFNQGYIKPEIKHKKEIEVSEEFIDNSSYEDSSSTEE